MYSGKLGSILWVIGDTSALLTLAATIGGFIPPIISLVVLCYYLIQIRESVTIQRWTRNRRLRKLVKLRARAVEYELYLHNKNKDLAGLVAANRVHVAAETAAAKSTLEQYDVDEAYRAKKEQVAIDQASHAMNGATKDLKSEHN